MKTTASIFGIGYIKGGGTIAALVAAVIWLFLPQQLVIQVLLTAVTLVFGIWSGNVVEAEWGKDSSKVVIDEVAGMFVSLLFLPVSFATLACGFVLFRFFDIVKPLGVRRMERFSGGWGVMMDDILAGIYANLVLQLIIHFQLLPFLT